MTGRDLRHLANELRELFRDEEARAIADDGGIPVMTSVGYVTLWAGGDVTTTGAMLATLDVDSVLAGFCPVCGWHESNPAPGNAGHAACDTDALVTL